MSLIQIFICLIAWSLSLWFSSNWQEEFELWWKLILRVESVGEVDSSNSTVGMNLDSQSLYVIGTIGSASEIRQVELNLVPALIKSHRHCANKRLHPCCWLIVRCSEPSSNTLIIEYLNFKREVLLQVFNDHNQEWKLDCKCLLWIKWSVDVVGWHIGSHDLKDRWLNIRIGYSLDVTISHTLVPNLQWFRTII